MIAAVAVVTAGVVALAPGAYALVVTVEGPRSVPVLGTLETHTESWSYVELVADPRAPGAFVATETACSIESDGGLFVARAEPALLAKLVPSSWALQVSSGEVTADRGTYALGYRVAPGAERAAVPTRSDDPRVTDPDGDGIPGAAMSVAVWGIGTLRLQVASAWQTTLIGRVRGEAAEGTVAEGTVAEGTVAEGTIAEGTVKASTREEILSGLPMPGRLDPVQLREERSRFRLVPLMPRAPGASRCASVTALAEAKARR